MAIISPKRLCCGKDSVISPSFVVCDFWDVSENIGNFVLLCLTLLVVFVKLQFKGFVISTLVCCLRFPIPAWKWWLMNNNSGEEEIKITIPTNSELVGSSVSVIFFFQCAFGTWKIEWSLIVPVIFFIDQDVADVIAKYKWNFIPMIYPWKFDTCKKTDWCLANILSGINHIILFFSVLVLFFVFECLNEMQVTPFTLDSLDEKHAIYTTLPKTFWDAMFCYVGKTSIL